MICYLAGAFSERPRVRAMMARLREAGITISHDWTADPPPGVTSDAELTSEQRLKLAHEDLDGVILAEVVWLLAPTERGSCGSWVEFGHALGRSGITTIVSGPEWRRSIFTELADYRFESDEKALVALLNTVGVER